LPRDPIVTKQVEHPNPFKGSPGSHSQLVGCSVGITSCCYLLASQVAAIFWHLHSRSALHHCIYIASAPQYFELISVLDYS